jgi:hypothetical protein
MTNRLNIFMGLKRERPSAEMKKNTGPNTVMLAEGGNQASNRRIESQHLDSSACRNNASRYRVSILSNKLSATFLFLVVFGLTLARAEISAAQGLEKVRIACPVYR